MTTQMPFIKVHGAGNDFVLLPDLDDRMTLTPGLTRALCDRRRGIGADGVIRLGAPRPGVDADLFMDYRNADGSLSEMCGNGVRTVAKYGVDRGLGRGEEIAVDTRGGVKRVTCQRGPDGLVAACTVDMGAPVPGDIDRALVLPDGGSVRITTLSMDNPHAVIVVDDIATAPVAHLGPLVATHAEFPDGTNVEFIAASGRATVRGRIWERGVGETLASGTGGAAMAVAAVLNDLADRDVAVVLPGGILQVSWTAETLFVTGPAVEVASGTLDPAWLADGAPAANVQTVVA
ncbi:MAG TPA: diaminopimelate epimerase [Euzebya sp.]|nr:diaminopimelate epimerase [Euzebya sp.]